MIYDYICTDCDKHIELTDIRQDFFYSYCCQRENETPTRSRYKRIYNTPGLGKVAGAGSSPPRRSQ